jgi:hypothetical protein
VQRLYVLAVASFAAQRCRPIHPDRHAAVWAFHMSSFRTTASLDSANPHPAGSGATVLIAACTSLFNRRQLPAMARA